MKNILSIILLFFSIQLFNAQKNVIKTVEIKTQIFCDHCLQCESCDENIFNSLKDNNKGIRIVKVDTEKNIISIKYHSEKTNLEELEKAIAMAGFKANNREPDNKAYESLDGCCKKK